MTTIEKKNKSRSSKFKKFRNLNTINDVGAFTLALPSSNDDNYGNSYDYDMHFDYKFDENKIVDKQWYITIKSLNYDNYDEMLRISIDGKLFNGKDEEERVKLKFYYLVGGPSYDSSYDESNRDKIVHFDTTEIRNNIFFYEMEPNTRDSLKPGQALILYGSIGCLFIDSYKIFECTTGVDLSKYKSENLYFSFWDNNVYFEGEVVYVYNDEYKVTVELKNFYAPLSLVSKKKTPVKIKDVNNNIISKGEVILPLISYNCLMPIITTFKNDNNKMVVTGRIARGNIKVNDEIEIVGTTNNNTIKTTVTKITKTLNNRIIEKSYADNETNIVDIHLEYDDVSSVDVNKLPVLAIPGTIKTYKKFRTFIYSVGAASATAATYDKKVQVYFYHWKKYVPGTFKFNNSYDFFIKDGNNIDITVTLDYPIPIESDFKILIKINEKIKSYSRIINVEE